jgi:hypothetical protein
MIPSSNAVFGRYSFRFSAGNPAVMTGFYDQPLPFRSIQIHPSSVILAFDAVCPADSVVKVEGTKMTRSYGKN